MAFDYWKIIGGAAAGIAAVVALPIAGPIGAITLMGAGIAAGVGAAAGAVAEHFDDSDDVAEKRGEQRGENKAKAEFDLKLTRLAEKIEATVALQKQDANHFNFILALTAVGLSCANCDGEISTTERQCIDEFVCGLGAASLPERVRDKIAEMSMAPPSISTAFAMAKQAGLSDMSLFDDLIEVVSYADGNFHGSEAAFKSSWAQLKAA